MLTECKLYIVAGHPLCTLAEAMLGEWVEQAGLWVELVDVSAHPQRMAQWGDRLPMLERLDTGMQLPWPFEPEDIAHFLK